VLAHKAEFPNELARSSEITLRLEAASPEIRARLLKAEFDRAMALAELEAVRAEFAIWQLEYRQEIANIQPRTPYRYQEIGYICSECEIAGKPSRFYSYKGEHPKKVTAAVLAALLCLSTHAAEFGLTWSRKAEPVRTNYNGQVVSGRIAEPTKEFWQAWRTNKAELKEQGYTCRPIGKHWQVIRIEEKGSK
jgi:hypothetical protein